MRVRILLYTAICMHAFILLSSCNSSKIVSRTSKKIYTPVDKVLYETIIKQDSALFSAFNTRNINALQNYFTLNLEIYQDNTGLRNYDQSIHAFTGLFKMDYVLTRTPVLPTIEVYAIKDYGAIETGQHTFCHTENGMLQCATFKFVHIWESKDGQWKIAKIITYDH